MELDRLTTGDRVLALSTLVFVLSLFLPWFGLGPRSHRGWDYVFFGIVPLVLVLSTTGLALTSRLTVMTLPELPVSMAQIALMDAAVAAVLVLVKVVLGDEVTVLDVTVELRRRFGLFLALVAASGVCLGAFLNVSSGDDAPVHGSIPPRAS